MVSVIYYAVEYILVTHSRLILESYNFKLMYNIKYTSYTVIIIHIILHYVIISICDGIPHFSIGVSR